MHVLYCGAWQPKHHSDLYIAQAMERYGWTVERATWANVARFQVSRRPDLLFLGKPPVEASKSIANLRRLHRCQVAMWYGDVRHQVPPNVAALLPLTDLLLVPHTGMFDLLQAAGGQRIAFWPLSAPPHFNWHVPYSVDHESDVAFLGSYYPQHDGSAERLAMLKAVSSTYRTRVWGNGWTGLEVGEVCGPAMMGEAAKVIRSSKVMLGCQHYGDVALSQSQRTWNVLACGGFLMNRYVPDLEFLFHDRIDQVFWHTTDELVDLVRHYLSHETERKAIAAAGRHYFVHHHTYDHRIRSLACYLEGRSEGTPWEWTTFL